MAISHIEYAADQPPSILSRWISRVAVFAAVVLAVTIFLHRLFGLPTPVALNIAAGVFVTAAIVVVLATIAGLDIWITGRQGAPRVIFGTTVALGLLAIPAGLFLLSRDYPEISDISTDVDAPPEFDALAAQRSPGSNPVQYPKDRFAALQAAYYPDLKTVMVPRPGEETFEIVLQALAKMRLTTTTEAPPDEANNDPGFIEVADKTMILGFVDDVAIRVIPDENGKASWLDVRSASRYGRNDFGRNAERVRTILKEISARLEATIPGDTSEKMAKAKKPTKPATKPQKVRNPATAAKRSKPGPSQSGAPRAPGRKESLQE
jgi:hypothetical protein